MVEDPPSLLHPRFDSIPVKRWRLRHEQVGEGKARLRARDEEHAKTDKLRHAARSMKLSGILEIEFLHAARSHCIAYCLELLRKADGEHLIKPRVLLERFCHELHQLVLPELREACEVQCASKLLEAGLAEAGKLLCKGMHRLALLR